MYRLPAIALLLWLLLGAASAAAPLVVATIKPIHSLVAAVMEGVGEPALIVEGSASAHTYALTPSDARALEGADLVFWTGHGLELFLDDALGTLSGDAVVVELARAAGIELLPVRGGGVFGGEEPAAEEHEDHHHEHARGGGADMHYWLDPVNAERLLGSIEDALSAADPANAGVYAQNAAAEAARLRLLQGELTDLLRPVAELRFMVFHDAYQYFERRFGLSSAGSFTVNPDALPGARRIEELRAAVRDKQVRCLFAEPQFEPAILASVAEGTGARVGVLDPEGAALEPGPGLYRTLLSGLATAMSACLSATAP